MLFLVGGLLSACSDDADKAWSLPAEAHTNERIIANTAATDARAFGRAGKRRQLVCAGVCDRDRAASRVKQLLRDQTWSKRFTAVERKAYFGDLHVHTTYSFDGYAFGTLATPYDAYRFAKGEAIANPAGFTMQLSRPLDFYAVTDHGMFLGLVKAAADTSTEFSKNSFLRALSWV